MAECSLTRRKLLALLALALLAVPAGAIGGILAWHLVHHSRARRLDLILSPRNIDLLLREAVPQVESACGAKFHRVPKAMVASSEELVEIYIQDELFRLHARQPGLEAPKAEALARALARLKLRTEVGFYGRASHTVCVARDNHLTWARGVGQAWAYGSECLRLILVHELVHALDEDRFGAVRRLDSLEDKEQRMVLRALLEGHAQYVTEKIAESSGTLSLFQKMESGPSADEDRRFYYLDGKRFFRELERRGEGDWVSRVFRRPPSSREEILNPVK